MKIDGKTLDESFRDNQSMLNFARTMHENSRVKDTEIYPNYQEGLQGLFAWIYENETFSFSSFVVFIFSLVLELDCF